jgi:DNA-binding MarR family transcriptional regulator
MDRYKLTSEGRMRFRRMEIRANVEDSFSSDDYTLLDFIYKQGSATLEAIAGHTGLSWDQTTNRLLALMYHGFIEKISG